MAKTLHQTLASNWEVVMTVRKIGAGGTFKEKIFSVYALSRLDADVAARQKARKAGYEIQVVQDYRQVVQKSFHKKAVFGIGAAPGGSGRMPGTR
jgi:hypothetical protein